MSAVLVGAQLPSLSLRLTRAGLVRYAGASGDLNPIHYSDRVASSVALPGVIAHGMLTMGASLRAVNEWTGNPGSVLDYSTRFTRPVVVPDSEDGVEVTVEGVVAAVQDDGRVRVDLTVRCNGEKVLARTRVVVRL
ncbi:MaoC family dehydratase [Kitasatospora atroaurantiaca]|uniref:Acyl dehydratase n=1 Tax=Kitasatospora atroaurantiaca TaxID=285545 RepID=A0A561ENQ7_9ACTN|nr:MaoC/PaaZ C-terminal domain-containing protein [Kitasatospora atroaurantiaca]TWE17247.1 acyl dehydratase [Kitasatospora atroaurantiaca]